MNMKLPRPIGNSSRTGHGSQRGCPRKGVFCGEVGVFAGVVHEKGGVFCGEVGVFAEVIHEKVVFCGEVDIFAGVVHEKGVFCGQVDIWVMRYPIWNNEYNKALQRRGIRVSKTFEESRSSRDARPDPATAGCCAAKAHWAVC